VIKILVTGLALVLLSIAAGADEVEDQIRSTCRWIDSEETIPTSLLERITASDGDEASSSEGVASGCSAVLACLLDARSGSRTGAADGSQASEQGDPASLCWRLTDVERLSKETIDLMLIHLDGVGQRSASRGGRENSDPDPAACERFLRCLLNSGIGVVEDQSWREEFTRICAMTDVADTLSREDLQALIDDSEELLSTLEDLSAPEVKVYIFRLKMCRDLFVYTLKLLDSEAPAESPGGGAIAPIPGR